MIQIKFDRGLNLVPGQKTRCTVSWEMEETKSLNSVGLRIYWKTSGRGTEDEKDVIKEVIKINAVRQAGDTCTGTFDIKIPLDAPTTYVGKLFSIHWFAHAHLDIGFAFDKHETKTIYVRQSSTQRKAS